MLLTFQRSGYEVYLVEAPYKDPVVSISSHTLVLSLCSNNSLFGVLIEVGQISFPKFCNLFFMDF